MLVHDKYLKDLTAVKFNLIKFYYNSCSEWLREDTLDFIGSLNREIELYSEEKRKYEEKIKKEQLTIFDFEGVL